MTERIYLDFNATTPIAPQVAAVMGAAMGELWGNPSSVHAFGQAARAAVERARRQVARLVDASTSEIVFTSGATEAINWAHRVLPRQGPIVVTEVEHPAVLGACDRAVRDGVATAREMLSVDERGQIDPAELEARLRSEPVVLVSVMLANNETGNLFDVAEVAARCRAHGVPCHTDASQAVGRIPVSLGRLGVDLASFSSHKMYGPKGVGALYVRDGLELPPLLAGGPQERSRRAGTENLLGIIGFGAAAETAASPADLDDEAARQRRLRDHLLGGLQARVDDVVVNTDLDRALPNTLNVSLLGADAESLLMATDLEGVSISAGAACSAGSLEPSHVLVAMTDDVERRRSAVRISLGRPTTRAQVEGAVEIIARCVRRIRRSGLS
jgi:cysteine desulfurase